MNDVPPGEGVGDGGGVNVDPPPPDPSFSSCFGCCQCYCCCSWTYEGEGGRHAIFSSAAPPPSCCCFEDQGRAQREDETSPIGATAAAAAATTRTTTATTRRTSRPDPPRPALVLLRVRKSDLVDEAAAFFADMSSPSRSDNKKEGFEEGLCRDCECERGVGHHPDFSRREAATHGSYGGCEPDVSDDPTIVRLCRFLNAIVLIDESDSLERPVRRRHDDDSLSEQDPTPPSVSRNVVHNDIGVVVGEPPASAATASTGVKRKVTTTTTTPTPTTTTPSLTRSLGIVGEAYLDMPTAVRVPTTLARALHRRAIDSGNIPPSRINDWQRNDRNKEDKVSLQPRLWRSCWGLQLLNYRVLAPCPSSSSSNLGGSKVSVSLEVKPKAGYRTFSPLVNRDRRAKYRASRFVLLQQLWCQGAVEKNWATNCNTSTCHGSLNDSVAPLRSRYDPLDLFSMDRDRILQSIQALTYETPQNNAKLWIDGQSVALGSASTTLSSPSVRSPSPEWTREVDQALHLPNDSQWFAPLCAEILRGEPFLLQLLRLQMLDVLDGDGAVRAYRHLVDRWCGGSCPDAERLVDALEDADQDNVTTRRTLDPSPHPLVSASPFRAPRDSSRIVQLCNIVEQTRRYLEADSDTREDTASDQGLLDDLHHQALAVVDELTKDECVYLLRNWLLSLTMNDVSFFLTLMHDDDDMDEKSDLHESSALHSHGTTCPSVVVVRRQTKNATGLVSVEYSDTVGDGDTHKDVGSRVPLLRRRRIRYQIKVIDCEPKPAKKLRDREAKEVPFSLLKHLV